MDWKALLRQGVGMAQAAGNTAYAAAQQGLKSLSTGKGFNGVCAASARVILSDGATDAREVETAVNNIAALPSFSGYTKNEIRDKIEAHLAAAKGMAPTVAAIHLLGVVRDGITDRSAQEVLIAVLIQISAGDGNIAPKEITSITEIAKALGVDAANYPELGQSAAAPKVADAQPVVLQQPPGTGSGWSY